MSISGVEEMIANAKRLEEGMDLKARKAVREGGKLFGDELADNTPESPETTEHLRDHKQVSGVSIKSGLMEVQVGYDKEMGRIAHFPNSGTSKQDPQHFIEKTQAETKDRILKIFEDNLKI